MRRAAIVNPVRTPVGAFGGVQEARRRGRISLRLGFYRQQLAEVFVELTDRIRIGAE
jgi:hypothetical protein